MFIGSTQAGPRAAAILSLLATTKANGICPQAWLPTTRHRDIDSLLADGGLGAGQ